MTMTTVFEAVAEPARREILDLLTAGPLAVGAIAERSGLSQPNASRHLRVLRESGLVQAKPQAQRRLYELRRGGLSELERWLAPYQRLWQDSLEGLDATSKRASEPCPKPTRS